MDNILNEIAEYAAYRVFNDKREYSLEELKDRCRELDDRPAGSDAETEQKRSGGLLGSAFGFLKGRKGRGSTDRQDASQDEVTKTGQPEPGQTEQGRSEQGQTEPGQLGQGQTEQGDEAAAGNEASDGLFRFGRALKKPGISVISEIKKASPSKGIISEDFPYLDIAGEYQRSGADCISCLTEPKWFMGSDDVFAAVRAYSTLPMIRKDFVVDEYQLYQAKLLGADAVLLICALLGEDTINYYLDICRELKMDALVETHDASEIEAAVRAGARIIGVNNRNLKDFSVDFANAMKLRSMVPDDCIYVAESGVKSAEDAAVIKEIGADAVLIGEALMRANDKAALIRAFKEM